MKATKLLRDFRTWLEERETKLTTDEVRMVKTTKMVLNSKGNYSRKKVDEPTLFYGQQRDNRLIRDLVTEWTPLQHDDSVVPFYLNGLFYDGGNGVYFAPDYEAYSKKEHYYSLLYQALIYLYGAYTCMELQPSIRAIHNITNAVIATLKHRLRVNLFKNEEGKFEYPSFIINHGLTSWFMTRVVNEALVPNPILRVRIDRTISLAGANLTLYSNPFIYHVKDKTSGIVPRTYREIRAERFFYKDEVAVDYKLASLLNEQVNSHLNVKKTLDVFDWL